MALTPNRLKSTIHNGFGQEKLNSGPEFLTGKSILLASIAFLFSQELELGFGALTPLRLLGLLSTRTE